MRVCVSVCSSLNAMCDISDDVLSSHLAKCQTEAEKRRARNRTEIIFKWIFNGNRRQLQEKSLTER